MNPHGCPPAPKAGASAIPPHPLKAGPVGFEPTTAGVKVLCLTAWRWPNTSTVLPTDRIFCKKRMRLDASRETFLSQDAIFRDKKKFPCGKGEYRDSNPGPPEPQSGAITNFAIPTMMNSRLTSQIQLSLKGFEPPTHGLEGRCSIQLSYRLTLSVQSLTASTLCILS